MPGTMSAFAEAYQKMNDGNLQGQEAIAMFLKDMGDGKISSSKIMPYVGTILSERSQSKLGIMKQSSMAEVARYQNVRDDQIQKFGEAGGESGLARIWWSITEAIKETTGEMEFLGRVWDKVSKGFATAILIPQSIKRMFDGRDSLVKDILINFVGEDSVNKFLEDWKVGFGSIGKAVDDLKTTFEGLFSTINSLSENNLFSKFIENGLNDISKFGGRVSNLMDSFTFFFGSDEDKAAAVERIKERNKEGGKAPTLQEQLLLNTVMNNGLPENEKKSSLSVIGDWVSGNVTSSPPAKAYSYISKVMGELKEVDLDAEFPEGINKESVKGNRNNLIINEIIKKAESEHGSKLYPHEVRKVLSSENQSVAEIVSNVKEGRKDRKQFVLPNYFTPIKDGYSKEQWEALPESDKTSFINKAKETSGVEDIDIPAYINQLINTTTTPLNEDTLLKFIEQMESSGKSFMPDEYMDNLLNGMNNMRPNEFKFENTFQISGNVDNPEALANDLTEKITSVFRTMVNGSMVAYTV